MMCIKDLGVLPKTEWRRKMGHVTSPPVRTRASTPAPGAGTGGPASVHDRDSVPGVGRPASVHNRNSHAGVVAHHGAHAEGRGGGTRRQKNRS